MNVWILTTERKTLKNWRLLKTTVSRLIFKYGFFKVNCRWCKDKIWMSCSIRISSSGILSSSFSSGSVLKSLSRRSPLLGWTLILPWVTQLCLKILRKATAFYIVSWFGPLWACFSFLGLSLPSKLSYIGADSQETCTLLYQSGFMSSDSLQYWPFSWRGKFANITFQSIPFPTKCW